MIYAKLAKIISERNSKEKAEKDFIKATEQLEEEIINAINQGFSAIAFEPKGIASTYLTELKEYAEKYGYVCRIERSMWGGVYLVVDWRHINGTEI